MDLETILNILTGKYGEILETHAMWECIAALGAKLSKEGGMWCFHIDGILAYGGTVYDAACAFYDHVKTYKAT